MLLFALKFLPLAGFFPKIIAKPLHFGIAIKNMNFKGAILSFYCVLFFGMSLHIYALENDNDNELSDMGCSDPSRLYPQVMQRPPFRDGTTLPKPNYQVITRLPRVGEKWDGGAYIVIRYEFTSYSYWSGGFAYRDIIILFQSTHRYYPITRREAFYSYKIS